ncbi:hypothetical protein JCM16303_005486 [Sporobolomyces ruberrimus]
MLLDQVIQPSTFSLFSSTSSHPLLLATSVQSSTTAPIDGFISLLDDATNDQETLVSFNGTPSQLAARSLAVLGKGQPDRTRQDLRSRVLHLQDPDCRTTSIRWGTINGTADATLEQRGLGIELEYLHLQVKNLGQNFYFDVAVKDDRGEVFVFRSSNFQSHSKLYPSTSTSPTLLHLPISFPPPSPTLLTSWCTLTLSLPSLLSSLPSLGASTPGKFKCILGIQVQANCRLRRIWFSRDGKEVQEEEMAKKGMMSELAMYAV